MALQIIAISIGGSAAVLLVAWAAMSGYYRLCFYRMKRRHPLKSHPYYPLLRRCHRSAHPLKTYSRVPRDGNCGFYSVLAAAYPILRAEAIAREGPKDVYASGAVVSIFGACSSFEEVSYAEAKALVGWLREVIAKHVTLHAEHYEEALAGLGHTPRAFARSVTTFWWPTWLDHLGLCALSAALRLHIVLFIVSSSSDTCYVNDVGRGGALCTICLLNVNNRHFEPAFCDTRGALAPAPL